MHNYTYRQTERKREKKREKIDSIKNIVYITIYTITDVLAEGEKWWGKKEGHLIPPPKIRDCRKFDGKSFLVLEFSSKHVKKTWRWKT